MVEFRFGNRVAIFKSYFDDNVHCLKEIEQKREICGSITPKMFKDPQTEFTYLTASSRASAFLPLAG